MPPSPSPSARIGASACLSVGIECFRSVHSFFLRICFPFRFALFLPFQSRQSVGSSPKCHAEACGRKLRPREWREFIQLYVSQAFIAHTVSLCRFTRKHQTARRYRGKVACFCWEQGMVSSNGSSTGFSSTRLDIA